MQSVICQSPGRLRLYGKTPRPVARKGQVLVQVRRVALGAAELAIFRGTTSFLNYPRVMGQELAGEVVQAPARSALQPGDPVYVIPYLNCGQCAACLQGHGDGCARTEVLGVQRDGALAEYVAVPERFVHPTRGLALDDAALLPTVAVGVRAVRRAGLGAGQRALIVGAGPTGLATALFARSCGALVTVLEARPERIERARQLLGTRHVVAMGPEHEEELASQAGGVLFDAVFDATGDAAARARGASHVAQCGTYLILSGGADPIAVPRELLHQREIRLMGSRNAGVADFEEARAAIEDGRVHANAFVTHRTTLSDLPECLPSWAEPGSALFKALVEV